MKNATKNYQIDSISLETRMESEENYKRWIL